MINDDLAKLFEGDPSAPKPMSLRQGVVEEWDATTGDNTISVAGGVLVNVPVLTSESASLAIGDVVSLLTTEDRVLLLGKVTTPGDPGTVPTWVGDLTALAPLVDLAAVTTGTTINGATVATSGSSTDRRIVIQEDPDNRIIFYSGEPGEVSPAYLNTDGEDITLIGPVYDDILNPNATLFLSSARTSGALANATLNARDGLVSLKAGADFGDPALAVGIVDPDTPGFDTPGVRVVGPLFQFNGVPVVTTTDTQTLTNKDLSDASNTFPATLTPRTVYKTADTTINNSTALATDPHLQIAGIAAGTYALDALVIYSSSAVADWKGFMTGTGSLSDRLLQVLREPLSGNEFGVSEGAVTFTAAGNGVGAKRSIRIVGTFTATAGSQAFNLQWAQNTAEVSDTVVHKGSYYRIQKIA